MLGTSLIVQFRSYEEKHLIKDYNCICWKNKISWRIYALPRLALSNDSNYCTSY